MCIPEVARGQPRVVTSREEEKRADNEATFRAANERIREAEQELDPPLARKPDGSGGAVARALAPREENA